MIKSWMKWAAAGVLAVAMVPAISEARLHRAKSLKSTPASAKALMAVKSTAKPATKLAAKKATSKKARTLHHKSHAHRSLSHTK